jgi:hypothetical protein
MIVQIGEIRLQSYNETAVTKYPAAYFESKRIAQLSIPKDFRQKNKKGKDTLSLNCIIQRPLPCKMGWCRQ